MNVKYNDQWYYAQFEFSSYLEDSFVSFYNEDDKLVEPDSELHFVLYDLIGGDQGLAEAHFDYLVSKADFLGY